MTRGRTQLRLALATVLLVVLSACTSKDDAEPDAGSQDSATPSTGTGGSLPNECPGSTPFTLQIDGGEALPGIDAATFEVTSAATVQQPITPDPDGELDFESGREAAAATDLLAYTIYLADYDLGEPSMLFGPTPPVDGTHVAFTIVPPTEEPIADGDTIAAGRPDFRSVTTFATVGVTYQTGVSEDVPAFGTDGDTGSAEVLYLDAEWLCIRFRQNGTLFGAEGGLTWAIDTVVAAPIVARVETSFT